MAEICIYLNRTQRKIKTCRKLRGVKMFIKTSQSLYITESKQHKEPLKQMICNNSPVYQF